MLVCGWGNATLPPSGCERVWLIIECAIFAISVILNSYISIGSLFLDFARPKCWPNQRWNINYWKISAKEIIHFMGPYSCEHNIISHQNLLAGNLESVLICKYLSFSVLFLPGKSHWDSKKENLEVVSGWEWNTLRCVCVFHLLGNFKSAYLTFSGQLSSQSSCSTG